MKENKLINLDQGTVLGDFNTIEGDIKKEHAFIVEESGEKFSIVKEFSSNAKSGSSFTNEAQTGGKENAPENNFVYAEEIVEDNDDELYEQELHDKTLVKQRHRTYGEISKEVDDVLFSNGWEGSICFPLLTAMKFSRLLYFKNGETTQQQIDILTNTVGCATYNIELNDEKSLTDGNQIFEIFDFAKKNINKPVFINVGVHEPSKILERIRPLYNYIDNPEGDNFLIANGRSMIIPNNIYIIFSLNDVKDYFDVSRRLLRYSAIVDGELKRNKIDEQENVCPIILEELRASFREANEDCAIEEETWRKVDELISTISSVNGYSLQNKIQRRIEDSLILLIANNTKPEDALDIVLANFVLPEAIITTTPVKYMDEVDLIEKIDDVFGTSGMKRSRQVIKDYLSLFNKKGERQDAE